MQAQPRHRFELFSRPGHSRRHETLPRIEHAIRIGLAAQAPQQAVKLEPCTAAGRAFGVAAVLRQQHTNVHLVGLAFQVAEEARDAVPLLLPIALPVWRAVHDPIFLRLCQLGPRCVTRNAGSFGIVHQVVLVLFPGRCLQRLDGAGAQGEPVVRYDQTEVDADHAAETATGLARPDSGVEREHRRDRVGIPDVALGAMQAGGELPDGGGCCGGRDSLTLALSRKERERRRGKVGNGVDGEPACAALQTHLDGLQHTHPFGRGHAETVGHHVEHLARPGRRCHLALGMDPRETAGRQPLRDFFGAGGCRQFNRKGDDDARVARRPVGQGSQRRSAFDHRFVDRIRRIVAHRQTCLAIEQLRSASEQQLQVVVEFGHRADRGARGTHRVRLIDGNGGGHALHLVDCRLVHAVEKLARVRRESLDIAALAFGVERVEHQARLARAAGAGDHRHLAGADVEVDVLQVMLACAANTNKAGGHVCPGEATTGRGQRLSAPRPGSAGTQAFPPQAAVDTRFTSGRWRVQRVSAAITRANPV